jgi:hypothetical protein
VLPALLSLSSSAGWILLGSFAFGLGLCLRGFRVPWPYCVVAVACCATLNLGLLVLATAAFVLISPGRAGETAIAGVATALGTVALWSGYVARYTAAGLSGDVVWSLGVTGLTFPLGGVAAMVDRWPLVGCVGLTGLAAGWRVRQVRLVAFLALASVAFLGVVALGPKPRYFLTVLPLLFALSAVLPIALRHFFSRTGYLRLSLSIGLTLVLANSLLIEHARGGRDLLLDTGAPLALPRLRTAPYERWTALVRGRAEDGPIICNDDLGCLLIGRQATHWWLSSETEAATYGFRAAAGWRSWYTGIPILVGEEVRWALNSEGMRGAWIIVLDTAKHPASPVITTSAGSPELVVECEEEGMLVLRAPTHGTQVGPGPKSEVEPCTGK